MENDLVFLGNMGEKIIELVNVFFLLYWMLVSPQNGMSNRIPQCAGIWRWGGGALEGD